MAIIVGFYWLSFFIQAFAVMDPSSTCNIFWICIFSTLYLVVATRKYRVLLNVKKRIHNVCILKMPCHWFPSKQLLRCLGSFKFHQWPSPSFRACLCTSSAFLKHQQCYVHIQDGTFSMTHNFTLASCVPRMLGNAVLPWKHPWLIWSFALQHEEVINRI